MPTVINPQSLTPSDAVKLMQFFDDQSKLGVHVWNHEETYTFQDNSTFQFTHHLIQRKRKEGKAGVRYEFISEKELGKGAFGTVYEIAGTLALEPDNIRYKQAGYNNKTRVVKIQAHNLSDRPVEDALREYELSKKAPHLAAKEPTIQDLYSFSVMRKLKGKDLFDIINEDLSGKNRLNLQQRIDLSQALLKALKEQVSDKGIIHRDIKGENIFVDFTAPMTVTIFDFGVSVAAGKPDGKNPGSYAYMAPEIWFNNEQTVKVDVFSMARVIALLWQVDTASYSYKTAYEFIGNALNVDLSSLFRGLPELNIEQKTIIRSTLEQMTDMNASYRFSVEQAIAEFDKLTPQKKLMDDEEKSPPLAANNSPRKANVQGNHSFFNRAAPSGRVEQVEQREEHAQLNDYSYVA